MDNRYNRHNRQKYSLKVHIVLVTKYRKQLLKGSITDDVKQEILDIANTRGYEIIAIETDKDHIHFLLSYDTTDQVCERHFNFIHQPYKWFIITSNISKY